MSGSYPADPAVRQVTVEIDEASGLLLSLVSVAAEPRSTLDGLIDADGDPLYSWQRFSIASYSFDVAEVAPPPVGRITAIAPTTEAPFFVSIPADWMQIPPNQIAEPGGIVDGYEGPENLSLIIVLDFVDNTGLETLNDYAAFIEDVWLSDMLVETSLPTTTLQGAPAWLLEGVHPDEGWHFKRLIYMSPQGVAFNIIIYQGVDELGVPVTVWDENPGLIDFMLNSFLVFRGEGV